MQGAVVPLRITGYLYVRQFGTINVLYPHLISTDLMTTELKENFAVKDYEDTF